MASRLNLQKMLEEILGSKNVYFQPPSSKEMDYPCIIYERARINTDFADNKPYKLDNVYRLTYVDTDPDSDMPDILAKIPQCVFERPYTVNNLYHYAFRLVY